jgi:hypothetical protein
MEINITNSLTFEGTPVSFYVPEIKKEKPKNKKYYLNSLKNIEKVNLKGNK